MSYSLYSISQTNKEPLAVENRAVLLERFPGEFLRQGAWNGNDVPTYLSASTTVLLPGTLPNTAGASPSHTKTSTKTLIYS